MAHAYLGLGSNLADPHLQIEAGLAALAALPESRLLRYSRLYRSEPWGRLDQPDFVNAVAAIETSLSPRALLDELLGIERAAGRERNATRWGPRVLDLDILSYADLELDEPGLHLPHPHLHQRAFVLVPLAEIAPNLHIPGRGRVEALLAHIDASACRALESRPATTE